MCSCIIFTNFASRSAFKADNVVVGLVLSFSFFLSGFLWAPRSWAGADWMSWAEKEEPKFRYFRSSGSCLELLDETMKGMNVEGVPLENHGVRSLNKLIFGQSPGVFLFNNPKASLVYDRDRPVVEMMFSVILDGLIEYKTRLVGDISKPTDGEGSVMDYNQVFNDVVQGMARDIFRGLMQIYLFQPVKEVHFLGHKFKYLDGRGSKVVEERMDDVSAWVGTILNHLLRLPILTQAKLGGREEWKGRIEPSPLDRVIVRMLELKGRYEYALREKKARDQSSWNEKFVGFFQSSSPPRELFKVRLKMIKFILYGKSLDFLEDGD